ncbi:ABC transporter permease [bacterium]|nr:ABC transporter permease [bacterium]
MSVNENRIRGGTRGGGRLGRELSAIRAFILRDLDLTKRYLGWDIVWLVYNLINAVIIGLIGLSSGAAPEHVPGGQPYVFYLLIGAVMWNYLAVLFIIIAETVAWERWEGTLEYTFMAPIHRLTHLFGVCAYATIYGVIRTILMLGILVLAFHLDLSQANLLSALVVLIIGSFAMVGLGLIAAVAPLLSPEKGAQATHILLAVTLLVSGVYYPISVLPKWLQPAAYVAPAYWALVAERKAFLGGVPLTQLGPELLGLVVSGLVFIPLGYAIFAWGERYAKRVGLLKRSG